MNDNDIKEMAARHYPDPDDLASSLFQFLVVVADLYVRELEDTVAANEPAPFMGGTTPLDAAMLGLWENLVGIREGRERPARH